MKKLLFIINPVAGKKHAGSSMYNVVKRFCSAGYLVTIAVTQYKGHGHELAMLTEIESLNTVLPPGVIVTSGPHPAHAPHHLTCSPPHS